jgi:hypothetical protein
VLTKHLKINMALYPTRVIANTGNIRSLKSPNFGLEFSGVLGTSYVGPTTFSGSAEDMDFYSKDVGGILTPYFSGRVHGYVHGTLGNGVTLRLQSDLNTDGTFVTDATVNVTTANRYFSFSKVFAETNATNLIGLSHPVSGLPIPYSLYVTAKSIDTNSKASNIGVIWCIADLAVLAAS